MERASKAKSRQAQERCSCQIYRSARAINFLKSQGYTKVKNVVGGISAYSERIDPNVPQY